MELTRAFRGVQLSYETVRRWCDKFGKSYADKLRRKRPKPGDEWHLDEVFLTINGVRHYLWRAVVDQHRAVVDILVQPKRDRFAGMRFFRKLLNRTQRYRRVIITDKLRSYRAAKGVVLPRVIHRQSRYLNNRAENSHQPARDRERRMKRSNQQGMPSGSLRGRALSHSTSDRSGTFSQPPVIDMNETDDFESGRKWSTPALRPELIPHTRASRSNLRFSPEASFLHP